MLPLALLTPTFQFTAVVDSSKKVTMLRRRVIPVELMVRNINFVNKLKERVQVRRLFTSDCHYFGYPNFSSENAEESKRRRPRVIASIIIRNFVPAINTRQCFHHEDEKAVNVVLSVWRLSRLPELFDASKKNAGVKSLGFPQNSSFLRTVVFSNS